MAVLHDILDNRDYMLDLCVRMAHHSSAIEGNMLSQDEVASIILDSFLNLKASEREFYEVRNYRFVLPVLIDSLMNGELLSNELIKKLHSVIMRDLHQEAGAFKMAENMIIGADFEPTKPRLVPTALKDWCDNVEYRLNSIENPQEKLRIILESHIQFERIHPFSDGNGRIGRLLIVYSCLQNNLPPLVIPKEQKALYMSFLRGGEFISFAQELQAMEQERMDRFVVKQVIGKISEVRSKTKGRTTTATQPPLLM